MYKQKSKLAHAINIVVLVVMMPILFASVRQIGQYLGVVPFAVELAGTGSMYPSLFWEKSEGGPDDATQDVLSEYRRSPRMYRYFPGIALNGSVYGQTEVSRSDMIAFQNAQTSSILTQEGRSPQSGFIKRVIALPGDKVELRDGYVIVNNEQIQEPYIAVARSTYGGTSLPDCQELVVPDKHYFVLGDNRKASSDSRGELGLVQQDDLLAVLPFSRQAEYMSLWRDTSHDQELATTPTLDIQEALNLLNAQRIQAGSDALTLQPRLVSSSKRRGEVILATNDFSTAATTSGYTFDRAMSDVGYHNTATGELVSHGFYTAEEWLANLTYFAKTKTQLHDQVYSEVGIAAVTQEINSCPTQVVVTHLGGYIPPSYDQQVVASWTKLKENLESVLPSWQAARKIEGVDSAKLELLISLLEQRLSLAREVESAMQNKQWLTKSQEARISQDAVIAEQVSALSQELNQARH